MNKHYSGVLCAFLLICNPLLLKAQNEFASTLSSLADEDHKEVEKSLKQFEVFTIDNSGINSIAKSKKEGISFNLNINGKFHWNVILEENEIRASDYKSYVTTDEGMIEEPFVRCQTYKGYANGDQNQKIRLSISENYFSGFIRDKENNYIFVQPLSKFTKKAGHSKTFIAYKQSDIKDYPKIVCGVADLEKNNKHLNEAENINAQSQMLSIGPEPNYIIELATDADFEWFVTFGANSNQQILGLINQLEGVYLEGVYEDSWNVYTTANDPYTEFDDAADAVIDEFIDFWNTNRTNVHRDLAFLFTGKDIVFPPFNIFGQVAEIGAVCSNPDNAYGYVDNFPQVAFTLAHEIGHTLDGRHVDGDGCGNIATRTLMCQDIKQLWEFSAASLTRIENHLTSTAGDCLRGAISEFSGHERICNNRTTGFTVQPVTLTNTTRTLQTSSSLNITGVSGSTVLVRAATAGSGSNGWLQATYTHNTTGEVVQIRRDNIPFGPEPANFSITSFPACAGPNQVVTLVANISNVNYNWVVNGGTLLNGQGNQSINVRIGSGGFMAAHCTVTGSADCGGPSGISSIFVGACFGFSSVDSVNIFPIPASNSLTIELLNQPEDAQPFNIEILNDFGLIVKKERSVTSNKLTISTKNIPDGLYFLKVIYENGILTRRIIIERE